MSSSESKWIHIYTETHDTETPLDCYRGMSLAFSSVVMDTSRHIRHPISRRMLSASEGLAPSEPPPHPLPSPPAQGKRHSLSPSPQKIESPSLSLSLSQKAASGSKTSLFDANGGLDTNRSYLRVLQPKLLFSDS